MPIDLQKWESDIFDNNTGKCSHYNETNEVQNTN